MKKLILATGLLALTSVHAQDYNYSDRFGVGASWGYNTPIFGNSFNNVADSDQSWSIHARYHLNAASGLEAAFTKHEFSDVTTAAQVTDLTYFRRLNTTERFSTILGAGAGVVDLTHYDPSSLKLGLKLRAGAEYAVMNCLSLGLNLDYQHINKMLFAANLPSGNIHILAARVGLTWYFGSPIVAGESAAPAVAAVPLDSDNDGVVDSKDRCPGTAKGVTVNAYGCAKEEKAEIRLNINFASGKAVIDHSYGNDMKTIADFMIEHPTTKIEIQGHTDSTGSKVLNDRLSQARANSVRNYIVDELKADASRITAKGYGSSSPVTSNSSKEGQAQNRRVIAVITE
jgi:OOP family OmpA-OmpF porin